MRKVIHCRPAPEIELEFEGGESISLRFDMRAVLAFQEYGEGGIADVIEGKINETDICARIIYAGSHEAVSVEDAKALVCALDMETVTEIMNAFIESMGIIGDEEKEKAAKKLTAQYLAKMSK